MQGVGWSEWITELSSRLYLVSLHTGKPNQQTEAAGSVGASQEFRELYKRFPLVPHRLTQLLSDTCCK